MQKEKRIRAILLILTIFAVFPLLRGAAEAKEPLVDWAWLIAQVKSGKETIKLPNDIICEDEEGLLAEKPVTIEGGGFSIKNMAVSGGQVTFHDVKLRGEHGLADENGGPGLRLFGEHTVAIFSGATAVEGGRSGPAGECGGDGILLAGDHQRVLLYDKASATGGTGAFIGGNGIHVLSNACSVLVGGDATCAGKNGLVEGGAGLSALSCSEVVILENGSAEGGSSQYTGGAGVLSIVCDACDAHGIATVKDSAILTSGTGADGGHGILMLRKTPGEPADLRIEGTPILIGGGGGTAGAAIRAENSGIAYKGEPMLFGGNFYETESEVRWLDNCSESGDMEKIAEEAGIQVTSHPASGISSIIRAELDRQNERYTPPVVQDGLTTRELAYKLGGYTVDRGKVSGMTLDGKALLISMFNGTMEKKLQYTPRLSEVGPDGGLRLVLIAEAPEEWLTVESTVAALRKLSKSGFTQFAYTSVDPVYCERIVNLEALLKAIDKEKEPPEKIILGTADDAVIFLRGKEPNEYKTGLMEKILVPLEELPES